MTLLRTCLVLNLMLLLPAGLLADSKPADKDKDKTSQEVSDAAREKLETAIPLGIRLLEEKKYEAFLNKFVIPADLDKITAKTKLEDFAREFAKEKAGKLLAVLKEIKGETPKESEDGRKATFPLTKNVDLREAITFVKIDKYWFIQN